MPDRFSSSAIVLGNDAPVIDLFIPTNTDFTINYSITNSDDTPFDLTGYSIFSSVRSNNKNRDLLFDFTVAIDADPATGLFNQTILRTQTVNLETECGYYDTILASPGGSSTLLSRGKIIFYLTATVYA